MKRLAFTFLISIICFLKVNAQALETEDSKPLLPGQLAIGTGIEFQTSNQGTETAMPLAFELGLTKKLTLLVEPVAFTNIHSKNGPSATGIGDLEATLFYQLYAETKILPSVSIAAEIKIPTAQNSLIGTGKTDYTPFIILSKTTGKFYTSFNLSYTFLGAPQGVTANNLLNYALGTTFKLSEKSILFAEIYGNTSSLGGDAPESVVVTTNPNLGTQELSGGENIVAFGYGYHVKKNVLLSLGVSYDNNHAVLFRPGIEWVFGGEK